MNDAWEGSPIGQAVHETNGTFRKINEQLARMNGVPVRDTIGKRLADVIPGYASQLTDVFDKVMETRNPVTETFYGPTRKSQPDKVMLATNAPLWGGEGEEIIGVIATVVDLTEVTREMRRDQRLIGNAEQYLATKNGIHLREAKKTLRALSRDMNEAMADLARLILADKLTVADQE